MTTTAPERQSNTAPEKGVEHAKSGQEASAKIAPDLQTNNVEKLKGAPTADLHPVKIAGLENGENAKKPGAAGAPTELADASKKTDAAADKTQPSTKANSEVPLLPTPHTVKPGETMEQIAREKLGPDASKDDITRYTNVALDANKVPGNEPDAGTTLNLPGRTANGDFFYQNPENKDQNIAVHKDGSIDAHDSADGTSYHETPLDRDGSYVRENHGPDKKDNFTQTYVAKDNYTWTETKDKDGTIHDRGSDGTTRTKDINGNWKAQFGPDSPKSDAEYNAVQHVTTTHFRDGSAVYGTDGSPEVLTIDKDGTRTYNNTDTGVQSVDKKDGTSTTRTPGKDGNYTLNGTGPKPADNFHETYDANTKKTVRTEGVGTPEERTTTHSPDGTIKVVAKDGDNYQRNPDGSEHHWGKKTFDKPANDYKNDAAMNQSRADLDKSISEHIPDKQQQADFKKDMAAFEARAQKEHLPPDEITKTYGQMNRLLNAKDSEKSIPAADRALLAEQLMHQTAHPGDTSQGNHETCNVTTVAKETLSKNPSKMAEVATSTALTGQFTAPDGKVITVDKGSLTPGAEESNVKPKDGERSYATQVLNVALVNDSLQRRNPPETYAQITPNLEIPGDTGERRMDASGKIIEGNVLTSNNEWMKAPLADPGLTTGEIATLGRDFNGDSSRVISIGDPAGGVESVSSAKELGQRLQQFKNQGLMPVSIAVDANHVPFRTPDDQRPGIGGHIVNVTDIKNGKVMISNNWDSKHNGNVSLNELYQNITGDLAGGYDGVNNDWPDEIKAQN
jgi:hypothetical protein